MRLPSAHPAPGGSKRDGVADDYFPFQPGLHRLYFDLVANGILPGRGLDLRLPALTQQQLRLFKKLPDPAGYPWVNDPSVEIALLLKNCTT